MVKKENNTKTFTKQLPKNLFSGFVVSLIALPLGLGLAIASEAPPISGIIAAVVGGIMVAILGGSNVTITGPGNGLVIVLYGAITTLGSNPYEGYLITLAAIIFAGVLMFLLGVLRMGILSDFFPASAIEGMLAAIGIGILAKQFHVMLGQIETKGSIISLLAKIPNAIIHVFQEADFGLYMAAGVGVLSLLIMVGYSKIRNKYFQLVPAPMWIVLMAVGLSYYYEYFTPEAYPIKKELLINIPDNVFTNFAFPDFSNVFTPQFFGVVLAITLIASIESLLSIKAVDKLDPEKRRSNVNKDLRALGLATVASGFLGGLNVVTVIARSSVNVNNGGTNRSANLFHAIFLLSMVLLFQDQLRKIPLPALAAILVYTGYKLAAPENIRKISKIGREQLLIFLITAISTIATNLITGILIGIVATFIVHVVINKNMSLFIKNILKPNVLMFKEEQKGSYYVSVKNFSSFLNLNKLKAKLDMIPEDQVAIVDFSLCEFVDDTVMENMNSYRQIFERKGGTFEIIGLDSHNADTQHPFAIRKSLPFKNIINIDKFLTRRQRLIEDVAKTFSWTYEPKKVENTSFLSDFLYFRTKKINHIYNRLDNGINDISLFDIEYSEGEFIAKEVFRDTIMHITLPNEIPVFTLDKEGFLELVYKFAGFEDINIDGYPDFSRRFYLLGENEKAIRQLFTKELILFFESNPYYHIESNGTAIMIKNKNRLATVKEIKELISFGQRLKYILDQVVVAA